MSGIREKLRLQAMDYDEGSIDRLEWEAADVIDALVSALEAVRDGVPDVLGRERLSQVVDAALAKAKGEA